MTPEAVQSWLDAYVAAWRSNDPKDIAALFTDEATYAYNPWDEPVRGVTEIVKWWLSEPDEPDTWEAEYRPMLVSGNRAIVVGETRYSDGKTYVNLWPLTFDDGDKCAEFVEWYMKKPD